MPVKCVLFDCDGTLVDSELSGNVALELAGLLGGRPSCRPGGAGSWNKSHSRLPPAPILRDH